jgi:uncharacterized membrane protein
MAKLNKSARRVLVVLGGIPLIVIGVLLMFLPGPGIPVLLLGLFVLSLEFEWAKRYMDRLKETQQKAIEKAKARKNRRKSKNT